MLIAIALGATTIARALQPYFGREPYLAAVGHLLAAFAAADFAVWLNSVGN